MGEYARFDGDEVKIGTCESLYYLRWQDRRRVAPLPGNVRPGVDVGLFYRLPIPAEDMETPGGYSSGWAAVDLPGFRFGGVDGERFPGPFRLYAVKHRETVDGREIVVPCVTDGAESWSLPDADGWPDVLAAIACPELRQRLEAIADEHGPREAVALAAAPAPPAFPYSGPYPF